MIYVEDILYGVQSFFMGKITNRKMTLEQFNYYLSLADKELFRTKIGFVKESDGLSTKRQIADSLKHLLSYNSIVIGAGEGNLPSDFSHIDSCYHFVGDEKYPIDIVESTEFFDRAGDSVLKGTLENPIAYIRGSKIYTSPTTGYVGAAVYITYYSPPTKPVLAMTIENGIMVYTATGSTNSNWPAEYYNDFVRLILKYLGVPEAELQGLVNYSMIEQEKQN